VKYPLEDLKPDAKVKGISVVELGTGTRPKNMFIYEKDGKSYVLLNTERVFPRPAAGGPSPFFTVRMELGLLGENEKINEQALLRLNREGKPATDRIQVVEDYRGVIHLDRLDKERALVVRQDDKGLTLTALALP